MQIVLEKSEKSNFHGTVIASSTSLMGSIQNETREINIVIQEYRHAVNYLQQGSSETKEECIKRFLSDVVSHISLALRLNRPFESACDFRNRFRDGEIQDMTLYNGQVAVAAADCIAQSPRTYPETPFPAFKVNRELWK